MQDLLPQLEKLLTQKRSHQFYADKLGITTEEVKELIRELRNKEKGEEETEEQDNNDFFFFEQRVNNERGTLESTTEATFEPKSDEELAELHKVDLSKYRISNYWSKLRPNGKFTSSILCTLIRKDSLENFRDEFQNFLLDYKPKAAISRAPKSSNKEKVALLLPKQDAHFNKYDIYGANDIEDRFSQVFDSINGMVVKCKSTNTLDRVIYVVGSDQFNSEWTCMTTKGTPQQNILSYQDAFKTICDFEVSVIRHLLDNANEVEVVFIPGNHDEYVGWHLIDWLEMYFREENRVIFESDTVNTKYLKYNNSALMLNHGDDIKPKDLAHKFPIDFKDGWSSCEHFYIFTGDKHHELSLDIFGIKFFQVPQLSPSVSKWDNKKGFETQHPESIAFVITESNGISDIYKHVL